MNPSQQCDLHALVVESLYCAFWRIRGRQRYMRVALSACWKLQRFRSSVLLSRTRVRVCPFSPVRMFSLRCFAASTALGIPFALPTFFAQSLCSFFELHVIRNDIMDSSELTSIVEFRLLNCRMSFFSFGSFSTRSTKFLAIRNRALLEFSPPKPRVSHRFLFNIENCVKRVHGSDRPRSPSTFQCSSI